MKQANQRTRLLKALQLIELKRTTNTKPENNTDSLQTVDLFTYYFPDCSWLGMALEFSWLLLFRPRAWNISHPMIQFCKIAEVMFLLFSYEDYGRSCLVKSPDGSVKLEYFPDVSCLGMALQETLRGSKKTTKLIIPPSTAAYILPVMIAKPCITCCRLSTRTCWASRERVECRRQDSWNLVEV